MDLPIGYDNFQELDKNNLHFVDKSLFIKDIIDDKSAKVMVITRPRRFGKTLNLSMLHCFFAANVYGKATKDLFNHLNIAKEDPSYMQHQGQYPVIFVTFKDIKDHNFETAFQKLANLISETYSEYRYLLASDHLYDEDKEFFSAVLKQQIDAALLGTSLKKLTHYLFTHHKVEPWLLIDEYDTPILSSYMHGYYDDMITLMRDLFGSALKTNPYLNRAVITGVLRIAKESLFSGLNNLEIYSLLRPKYGQYFGFTEQEVDELLKRQRLEKYSQVIKEWYNGYQAGNFTLYNPWSIVNCIKRQGEIVPYWVNTSDNVLIKDLLTHSSSEFKHEFETLLAGDTILHLIDENSVFPELKKSEVARWSLLLMTGYLKVVSQQLTSDGLTCVLAIPNREVRDLYQQIIKQWVANGHGIEWYNTFLNHLLAGNIKVFERELRHLMEQVTSVYDTANDPEAFYHGLMIGMTASLHYSKEYEVQSNRESGYGRYDYMIFSHTPDKPTLLLEFKKIEPNKDPEKLAVRLEQAAKKAVLQITKQKYWLEAAKKGSTHILKIGIAFCGKHFKIYYER